MKIVSIWLFFVIGAIAKTPDLPPKMADQHPPNVIRTCCAFGYDLSIAHIPFLKRNDLIDYRDLGNHQYLGGELEINGIIYTQKGGFIDIGHLRDYADWTAYLIKLISSKNAGENINLELGNEKGAKTLEVTIPTNESEIYDLAGNIAYDLSLWHEIATWFGSSYIPLVPEGYSSFSPEDLYSNLLGVKLGIEAVKSPLPYEEAMSKLLKEKLEELEVVNLMLTYEAMNDVEGLWWSSSKALPNTNVLLKRYFDEEFSLKPWLIDSLIDGKILSKPDLVFKEQYTFQVQTKNKIPMLKGQSEGPDKGITQNDFPEIIEIIKAEYALQKDKIHQKQVKVDFRKEKKEIKKGSDLTNPIKKTKSLKSK